MPLHWRTGILSLSSTDDIIFMKEGSEVPRRGQIAKRDVLPDPLYNSKLVTRLINSVMYDGKKGVAQKIVYGAFEIIREKTGKEPLEVFEAGDGERHACSRGQSTPCWRRYLSGAHGSSSRADVRRWACAGLRYYSRQRSEQTMKERLADEIMDAVNGPPVPHTKSAKTRTRWQKPTRRLHTYRW